MSDILSKDIMQTEANAYNSDNSDESESDVAITWYPGDGICPPTARFNDCCQSKYIEWKEAFGHQDQCPLISQTRAFFGLLKNVPLFLHEPPKHLKILGRPKSFLTLRSSLCIRTTDHPSCTQPEKSIDFLQCLGSPKPVTYKTAETRFHEISFAGHTLRSGYFTSIVLAWSYIISCRWVEILQQAGEDKDSFWPIVTEGRWKALVKRPDGTFHSPWMLRKEGTKGKQTNWTLVSPNSSLAFDILLSSCVLEGLEAECIVGLASVLILISRHMPPPTFAPPVSIPTSPILPSSMPSIFTELFQSIDKCIFLSSTQDALDSLLCSAFFDPSIPCNLLGAASLGITKALSAPNADSIDYQQLLNAVTSKSPHLSILWAAAICNDQANSLLNMAVSRANEFQTSYFIRPNISVPWSPAPPFGVTPVQNCSLEVRAHLAHQHRPISWNIYWILDSGERILAGENHPAAAIQVHNMCGPGPLDQVNELHFANRDAADEQSEVATSRLFNWHRDYDDGIWLDDGSGDIGLIRRLQAHAWISDPFGDSIGDEPVEEPTHRELCTESVLRWISDVEKSQ
ncbi:hypothetical protein P170DRAFT_493067 [Aspergillus steynii IBT 23096]|uniref:Uncharacterized protein n=1 Tax=Aspergillus steynii IBT 23096 TaxID=1392250 RepID=A0A2I2GDE8_9EURO|nr:uncharacterized protein P170DRAFT_493067 [Aspergillus steynii IBT 23096]PLB50915.1 hypothetical protein P170DRAFT_493067 [Aspergillus steynii IBT 23096]